MSAAGKPRLPIKQLQLTGLTKHNKGVYEKWNRNEVGIISSDTELKCPKEYGKETKKAWISIVPNLIKVGALTEQDLPALKVMFDSYQNYITAKKAYDEYEVDFTAPPDFLLKQTGIKKHLFSMMHSSLDAFNKAAARFGCTPTERSKLTTHIDQKNEDPLDVILGG